MRSLRGEVRSTDNGSGEAAQKEVVMTGDRERLRIRPRTSPIRASHSRGSEFGPWPGVIARWGFGTK